MFTTQNPREEPLFDWSQGRPTGMSHVTRYIILNYKNGAFSKLAFSPIPIDGCLPCNGAINLFHFVSFKISKTCIRLYLLSQKLSCLPNALDIPTSIHPHLHPYTSFLSKSFRNYAI